MYESQVAEHKMDIDRLQRELQEVKKKYYLQKKKDHQQRFAINEMSIAWCAKVNGEAFNRAHCQSPTSHTIHLYIKIYYCMKTYICTTSK